jgi:signal transduction histidine kinase
VKRNQERIQRLVADMLTIAKDRTPELAATDLNAVAGEVAELAAGRAGEAGVAIIMDLAEPPPVAPADAEALHKALLNLVANALDAVAEEDEPRIRLSTRLDPVRGRAEIVVEDNGPGVPPEDVERIFQVFVSTKGSKGTGLGLAVTRKAMREQDGDVELDPTQQGARFRLWLPAPRPTSTSAEPAPTLG